MIQQDEDFLNISGAADDIEILQTDIQRFLAILAFCLLPIFMLVQSIPVVSQEKDIVIENLTRRFEEQSQRLQKIKQENNELSKKMAELSSTRAQEEQIKSDPDSGKKGLYVAFESDAALLDLLESDKVQLFIAVTGVRQSFRVIRKAGRTYFEQGDPLEDLDLWEIKEIMVPGEILTSFRNWSTLASREKMFIVGLSPELSRHISERNTQSGRVLISHGGHVTFHGHGE